VTSPKSPHTLLPLKPLTFQVLLSLLGGEQHGYAIAQDITRRTSAGVTIRPGNLYRSLRAMLEDDLIVEVSSREARAPENERRRYYGLTRFGRRVAEAESQRLEALVADSRAARLGRAAGRS
jgi:DNA-binding PadR family transcriptional regulator